MDELWGKKKLVRKMGAIFIFLSSVQPNKNYEPKKRVIKQMNNFLCERRMFYRTMCSKMTTACHASHVQCAKFHVIYLVNCEILEQFFAIHQTCVSASRCILNHSIHKSNGKTGTHTHTYMVHFDFYPNRIYCCCAESHSHVKLIRNY